MQTRNSHEIILRSEDFWVVFGQRMFGPFDYQWSTDLHGIEFRYQGQKFGEFCSDEEFFADLHPYQLPLTVCQVAILVAANLVSGIRNGTPQTDRILDLTQLLAKHNFEKFIVRNH